MKKIMLSTALVLAMPCAASDGAAKKYAFMAEVVAPRMFESIALRVQFLRETDESLFEIRIISVTPRPEDNDLLKQALANLDQKISALIPCLEDIVNGKFNSEDTRRDKGEAVSLLQYAVQNRELLLIKLVGLAIDFRVLQEASGRCVAPEDIRVERSKWLFARPNSVKESPYQMAYRYMPWRNDIFMEFYEQWVPLDEREKSQAHEAACGSFASVSYSADCFLDVCGLLTQYILVMPRAQTCGRHYMIETLLSSAVCDRWHPVIKRALSVLKGEEAPPEDVIGKDAWRIVLENLADKDEWRKVLLRYVRLYMEKYLSVLNASTEQVRILALHCSQAWYALSRDGKVINYYEGLPLDEESRAARKKVIEIYQMYRSKRKQLPFWKREEVVQFLVSTLASSGVPDSDLVRYAPALSATVYSVAAHLDSPNFFFYGPEWREVSPALFASLITQVDGEKEVALHALFSEELMRRAFRKFNKRILSAPTSAYWLSLPALEEDAECSQRV